MKNLFNLSYWLDLQPPYLSVSGQQIFLTIVLFFFLSAVVLLIFKKRAGLYRKILNDLYALSLGNFVITSLLFFFRYETIPFLSGRFWLALWIISLAIWLYFSLKDLRKIPEKRKALKEIKEKNKYIP